DTKPRHAVVRDDHGGLTLKQCGYLDTICYLESVRKLIKGNAILLEEVFEDAALELEAHKVQYKDYEAQHLIFCQGEASNAWFRWVPVLPLKGETIRIQSACAENIILNRGVYAVPANQNGEWRVGATYALNDPV